MQFDWRFGYPLRKLFEEEVGSLGCRACIVEIFVSDLRQDPVAAKAAYSICVYEFVGCNREIGLSGEAGGNRLGQLDKCERLRMRTKILLNGIRVGTGEIRGSYGAGKRQKLFSSAS